MRMSRSKNNSNRSRARGIDSRKRVADCWLRRRSLRMLSLVSNSMPRLSASSARAPRGSARGLLDLGGRRHDVAALRQLARGERRLLCDLHALELRALSRARLAHALADVVGGGHAGHPVGPERG